MQDLTTAGQHLLSDAATKHGFSEEAAGAVLRALQKGNGMAQFNHPELGGMGQWSSGMVMIGEMGNNALKSRVDALCHDLADALNHGGVFHETAGTESPHAGTSGSWWPSELGSPGSSGAQNDMRYAVFPAARRIAVQSGGRVTVYDSGEHAIHGVSQAQGVSQAPGSSQTLIFSSQRGQVSTANLPVVKS